jgi:cyclopropane fatty-acyl-phospholipid synthase-like methyltransferase
MIEPTLDEAIEWRIPIWAPAVSNALNHAATMLPLNAKVLEIGYNSGMMSCYMAARYGWNVVGYDIDDSSRIRAETTARHYNLEQMTDFRVCSPDNTLSIKGEYDVVFLKSVLYHISDKDVYRSWLDWLHSIVRDGGLIIAVENGKGGVLDRLYRKWFKKSRWADFLLFDGWTEQEFRQIFKYVDIKYFGRFSQFFTAFPRVCNLITSFENRFLPPNMDHCFVASIVAQK